MKHLRFKKTPAIPLARKAQSLGVRASRAVTRDDLTYQALPPSGEHTNTGYKWLEKSHDFCLLSAADGRFTSTLPCGDWETYRAYYVDHVRGDN